MASFKNNTGGLLDGSDLSDDTETDSDSDDDRVIISEKDLQISSVENTFQTSVMSNFDTIEKIRKESMAIRHENQKNRLADRLKQKAGMVIDNINEDDDNSGDDDASFEIGEDFHRSTINQKKKEAFLAQMSKEKVEAQAHEDAQKRLQERLHKK